MTLLALERVCKCYTVGRLERVVLDDVSLSLDEGELVAIWGMPRSGRSTLLRIAAGIEQPDTGVVRFAERNIGTPGGHALGRGIGYCRTAPRDREGRAVLDEVVLGLRARGATHSVARQRAHRALDRVDASGCAGHRIDELNGVEALRVSLARTLVLEPSLLLIDEPVTGIDLLHRDELLSLVRSLADEGIAILMTVGEATALEVADRALRIGGGRLGGSIEPELAPVSDLERHRQARG